MQKTTSQVITNYLLNQPPQTVDDLSRKLILTKADIRYQLNRLIKEGIVKAISPVNNNKRGRPAFKFTINENLYPNNFFEIIEAFLSMKQDHIDDEYKLIADYLASQFDLPLDRHLLIQLNDLVSKLNMRNYKAKWETHSDGPILFFHNCPYRKLLAKHPGFCAMDRELLSILLKKNIHHKQSFKEQNSTVCKFQLLNL